MKINFYKVKHFWEDKTNAKWQVSSSFNNEVFEYIKLNYENLTTDRPNYKYIKNKLVFFYYKDGIDIFKRNIVELVAFTSPSNIDDKDSIYLKLKNNNVFDNQNEIELEVKSDNKIITDKKSNINFKKFFLVIFILICIFFIGYFFKKNDDIKIEKKYSQDVIYENFKESWNDYIKNDVKINEKFLLLDDGQDYIHNKFSGFLKHDSYANELEKLKKLNKPSFSPLIDWINYRNNLNFNGFAKDLSDRKFQESLSHIFEESYFSKTIVKRIVALNDFCYFFNENKDDYIKNGLDKKIKCEDIVKNTKDENIRIYFLK